MSDKAAKPARKPLPETLLAMPEHSPQEIKQESNPFTERDWRMLGYAWAGFALRLLFIAGGFFTLIQYLQARDERRIERALQLVEIWERPQYQDAQRALKLRIDGLNARYASLLGNNPSESEKRIYNERIGIAAMSEDGGDMPLAEFEEHFDRVVYFLNRVAFCVEGNLCKEAVADAYFRDFAASFWSYFAGHVAQERRRGAPNYAITIESWLADG